MSRHSEQMLDLCAGYVLGVLDDAEQRVLEQHLAEGCPDCEAELERLGEGVVLLAASAPPIAPPARLAPRVLELVRREGRAGGREARAGDGTAPSGGRVIPMPVRRRSSTATWGWAAAAAVLAVTSVFAWRRATTLGDELAAARTALKDSQHQLADQQQRLADERRWSALLDSGNARVVDMSLTPAGHGLRARAIYDPQVRRAVIVFSNFTPPAGSDYQLWALRDGKPASLGLIRADASGRAIVRLPDTGDPASLGAFAVSLEKAGGSSSETPEGPVVMVGKVGGL